MKNKIIILISGKQGSGKSSLAKALIYSHKASELAGAVLLKFADPLYEMHDYCLRILRGYSVSSARKDGKLLQLLGTEWGRNSIDENIWVTCLEKKIEHLVGYETVVVDDCRFPNELALSVPGWRVLKVRLECDKETRKARCDSWRENDTHPSEIALDDHLNEFDLIIDSGEHDPAECARQMIRLYYIKTE